MALFSFLDWYEEVHVGIAHRIADETRLLVRLFTQMPCAEKQTAAV